MCKLLGDLHGAEGQYGAAIEHYVRAVEQDPAYLEAWIQLHAVLLQLGRTEEAEVILRRIQELPSSGKESRENDVQGTLPMAPEPPYGSLREEWAPRKRNPHTLLYLGMVLGLGIVIAVFLYSGGQVPGDLLPTPGETVLDTSLVVSGWWTQEIPGGYRYDIQVEAQAPVSLYLCDRIDPRPDGGADCIRAGVSTLFESRTSFRSTVTLPPGTHFLLLVTPNIPIPVEVTLRRISGAQG
jgi:Predicted N-acetylglucosaminyl transferase